MGKAIWRLRIQENPLAVPSGPSWGSLQSSRKPRCWWGGAGYPLPKNPIPLLSALRASLSYPHSKISSDAVGVNTVLSYSKFWKCLPPPSFRYPVNFFLKLVAALFCIAPQTWYMLGFKFGELDDSCFFWIICKQLDRDVLFVGIINCNNYMHWF